MAQDNEIRLINKAWKGNGDGWKELVTAKITPDMFFNKDAGDIYQFALDFQQQHGSYPSENFIRPYFPNFTAYRITDPLSALIDAFKEWRERELVKRITSDVVDEYDRGKTKDAIAAMERGLAQLAAESMTDAGDVDLTDDPLQRLQDYLDFASRPAGLLGVTCGYPSVDNVTSGFMPGQLIVVVALPKDGKSTLAMQMAISAHEAGTNVMFQTIEMSKDEMRERHDAMRAGISYTRFRTGTLKRPEQRKYEALLNHLAAMDNRFVITESVTSIAQIQAKIEDVKPELVVVDGVYLLQSHPDFAPGSPQALTFLTRGFKQLAKQTQTTIILTTQALQQKLQGGKVTAHSIGYSSSFFQDADLIIGLQKNDAGDEEYRILSILASRNTGQIQVTLDWDWETGTFSEMGAP